MAKSTIKEGAVASFDTLFGARSNGERNITGGFKMLAHERISVRPQVRRTFPQGEITELRNSIHELRAQNGGIEGTGVLQALLVCPEGDGYRLIAGEKRFRSTKEEGLPEVPCIVVPAPSEATIRLLQLTENALRTSPPVLEEARAIRDTMNEQKLSFRDVARMLGKTLGYVTNRVAVLKMSEDVQKMVGARSDTLKHAPLIEGLEDENLRTELITAVVEDAISVRELERRIALQLAQNESEVFSRENTSSNQKNIAPDQKAGGEVFSRENTPTGTHLSKTGKKGEDGSPQNQPRKETTEPPEPTKPEPIETALAAARLHAAAAFDLLKDLPLKGEYSEQVRVAIEELTEQVQRLKQLVDL